MRNILGRSPILIELFKQGARFIFIYVWSGVEYLASSCCVFSHGAPHRAPVSFRPERGQTNGRRLKAAAREETRRKANSISRRTFLVFDVRHPTRSRFDGAHVAIRGRASIGNGKTEQQSALVQTKQRTLNEA